MIPSYCGSEERESRSDDAASRDVDRPPDRLHGPHSFAACDIVDIDEPKGYWIEPVSTERSCGRYLLDSTPSAHCMFDSSDCNDSNMFINCHAVVVTSNRRTENHRELITLSSQSETTHHVWIRSEDCRRSSALQNCITYRTLAPALLDQLPEAVCCR